MHCFSVIDKCGMPSPEDFIRPLIETFRRFGYITNQGANSEIMVEISSKPRESYGNRRGIILINQDALTPETYCLSADDIWNVDYPIDAVVIMTPSVAVKQYFLRTPLFCITGLNYNQLVQTLVNRNTTAFDHTGT